MEREHYDLVIGDEAWDVDYYYHENPELKRQPFVFLTDFVGCLPIEDGDEREAHLCADRNADDIEHVARFPYVRDAAIFVGNPDDVTEPSIRPGHAEHPRLDRPQLQLQRLHVAVRSCALADTDALRARLGYRRDETHRRSRRSAARPSAAICCTRSRRHSRSMKREVARTADDPGGRPAPRRPTRFRNRRARGQALRAQPLRAPGVLRPRAGAGRASAPAWSWSPRAGPS